MIGDGLHVACGCEQNCRDLPESDDHEYAICKGLPEKHKPLVEIVLVHRDDLPSTPELPDDKEGG